MSDSMLWSLGLAAVAFAAIYYPSFNRLARGLASPYAKADLGRRFSAAVVDGLLCLSTWLLFNRRESALLIGALYLLVRDSIVGRSLGKLCFGLVVIDPPIPKTVRFAEAPGRGVSILEHAPNSAGAQAYRSIAAALHDDANGGSA